jgi:cation transport regulator ChaB
MVMIILFRKRGTLHVILDNVGLELVSDFCLATVLTHFNLVDQIVFHAKAHPTFVSDALPQDVEHTLAFLCQHAATKSLAHRWTQYFSQNRWQVIGENYWNHYSPFWEDMPPDLRHQLHNAVLVIIKGDMNTRYTHSYIHRKDRKEEGGREQRKLHTNPLITFKKRRR